MTRLDDLLAEKARLNTRLDEINAELATLRLTSSAPGSLPYHDFVGQPVYNTPRFREWLIEQGYPPCHSSTLKVQTITATEMGFVVNLVENFSERVINGVPWHIAQDMRRAYKRLKENGE